MKYSRLAFFPLFFLLVTSCTSTYLSSNEEWLTSSSLQSTPFKALIDEINAVEDRTFSQNNIEVKQTIILNSPSPEDSLEDTEIVSKFYDDEMQSEVISISDENEETIEYCFKDCICHYSASDNYAYCTKNTIADELSSLMLVSSDNGDFEFNDNCNISKESINNLTCYQIEYFDFSSLFDTLTDYQFSGLSKETLSLPESIKIDLYVKNDLYDSIESSFSFSVYSENYSFQIFQKYDYTKSKKLPLVAFDAYDYFLDITRIIEKEQGFISSIDIKNKGSKPPFHEQYLDKNNRFLTHYRIGDDNTYTNCKFDNEKYIVIQSGSNPNTLTVLEAASLKELYSVSFSQQIINYELEKGIIMVYGLGDTFRLYDLSDFSPIAHLDVSNPLLLEGYVVYQVKIEDRYEAILYKIDTQETKTLVSVKESQLSSPYNGLKYYFHYFKKEKVLAVLDNRQTNGAICYYSGFKTTSFEKIYEGHTDGFSPVSSYIQVDHQYIYSSHFGEKMIDVTNGEILPLQQVSFYPYALTGEFEDYTVRNYREINERYDLIILAIVIQPRPGTMNIKNEHYRIYDKKNDQLLFQIAVYNSPYYVEGNFIIIPNGSILLFISLDLYYAGLEGY